MINKTVIVNNPLHIRFNQTGKVISVNRTDFMKNYTLYNVQFDNEMAIVLSDFMEVIE